MQYEIGGRKSEETRHDLHVLLLSSYVLASDGVAMLMAMHDVPGEVECGDHVES